MLVQEVLEAVAFGGPVFIGGWITGYLVRKEREK